MATQCFLFSSSSGTPDNVSLGTNASKLDGTASGWFAPESLSLTRGTAAGSVTTSTVAGTTLGVEVDGGGFPKHFISPPLDQDVTISGTVTFNVWMAESNMAANVGAQVVIERINSQGAIVSTVVNHEKATELPVTTRAAQNWTATPTSTAFLKGDRIRVRVAGNDGGGTMASGYTFSFAQDGPTAGADGDSYVTFTETFGFLRTDPTTTTLYPTIALAGAPAFGASAALLSAFTGADENPLSEGGNWAKVDTAGGNLKRVSNVVGGVTASAAAYNYWTPSNFGADCEAYLTIATKPSVNGTVRLGIRIQGEGGTSTWDGYVAFWQAVSGTDTLLLQRVTNGSSTTLATVNQEFATGDKVGLRALGSTIEMWRHDGSSWALLASVVDTTYASAGKVLIEVADSALTGRLDDVYAGTVTATLVDPGGAGTDTKEAWTARGSGSTDAITNTAAGWSAPIQKTVSAGGNLVEWFSKQLTAFTLAAPVLANVRALESNVSANASIRAELAVTAADGTGATVWAATTHPTELTTSDAAYTFYLAGDDLAVTDGQRFRLRLYIDDSSTAAMASTYTATATYAGASAAAAGDTYLIFGQTLTEYVAASSPVYLVMAPPR